MKIRKTQQQFYSSLVPALKKCVLIHVFIGIFRQCVCIICKHNFGRCDLFRTLFSQIQCINFRNDRIHCFLGVSFIMFFIGPVEKFVRRHFGCCCCFLFFLFLYKNRFDYETFVHEFPYRLLLTCNVFLWWLLFFFKCAFR